MNLPRLLTGCARALRGAPDWEVYFDFSVQGFYLSFVAAFLGAPFYILCAQMVIAQRAQNLGETAYLPLALCLVTYVFYALMFVVVIYMITLVFNRRNTYRPWVIIRQWTFFFLSLLAGLIACANLIGWLGFQPAIYGLLMISLTGLLADIRLAQMVGGFDWGSAVLTGCLITAMNLMIFLISMAQAL